MKRYTTFPFGLKKGHRKAFTVRFRICLVLILYLLYNKICRCCGSAVNATPSMGREGKTIYFPIFCYLAVRFTIRL